MPKQNYIPPNDQQFNAQLAKFNANIGNYAAVLGLSPVDLASIGADGLYFGAVVQNQQAMLGGAQQWTAWKLIMRGGGNQPMAGVPVAPALSFGAAQVAPGIEPRFRALAQRIKTNPNYNIPMGEALGIEGPQQTGPDMASLAPQIDVVISGNQVIVKWGWGGNRAYLDLCELQVDRSDGKSFGMLAYDTTPGYTDTQPFPAAPVIWIYRAIYRVGDHQVGQWSLPVSVTVPA